MQPPTGRFPIPTVDDFNNSTGVWPRSDQRRLISVSLGDSSAPTQNTPMKNTEVRPESASGRLAAYLESHKDAMTNEWVGRVRRDSAVPTDSMTKLEIIDHIPQIFDAISEALRQHRSDTTTEQLHEIAARHTL